MTVELIKLTKDNLQRCFELKVAGDQVQYIAGTEWKHIPDYCQECLVQFICLCSSFGFLLTRKTLCAMCCFMEV